MDVCTTLSCPHPTKVCVSAVEPELFPACVDAGAEMVELGNFDCFYDQVERAPTGFLPVSQ